MSPGGIQGVGVDLVENDRIRETLARWGDRFTARVFQPAERRYCDDKADPAPHYAGRFAAKEAVAKALGCGIGAELGWLDMEIIRDPVTGAPAVEFAAAVRVRMQARGWQKVLISFSHTRSYAVAQAVLVAND